VNFHSICLLCASVSLWLIALSGVLQLCMGTQRWQMRVDSGAHVYVAELSGFASIGRQQAADEVHPSHTRCLDGWRVVVARADDHTVSRRQLDVTPLSDGRFLLANRSGTHAVGLPNNEKLEPGASCAVRLPIDVRLGALILRLLALAASDDLQCLPLAPFAPGAGVPLQSMSARIAGANGIAIPNERLLEWLQTFVGLLHSAAGSNDFFVLAARALVDLVKLDSGRVVLRAGMQWQEEANHFRALRKTKPDWRPSSRVLHGVLHEKKTFWHVPEGGSSTLGLEAVVAAPILDRRGAVIGALYGERRLIDCEVAEPISLLEAMLVEVLASGVAAGLARVEQERVALRARLQLEQTFGPRLAAKLERHPELLQGRETVISVLICDLRGFSRISEKLGPAQTVAWVADVMGELTQCVQDQDGVVVDYVGDEVMAIWGAPEEQPDHAPRACRAALAMLARLPSLNERWESVLHEPIHLGIGVNSGNAQVGDVGTKLKLKYGAMGNTVNIASRVQGATKFLETPLLITDATRALLEASFRTRRLCQVRVVNIEQPVTLFELARPATPGWPGLKRGYEHALEEFTRGDFREACRTLGWLILDNPNDGPALLLLSRAVACLKAKSGSFDPVMVLDGK